MSTTTKQDWNPRDPSVLADQLRTYDDMRTRCPVAHSDAMHWSVFQHADVVSVLDDPETFINTSRHHAIPNAMNGPDHITHRAILEHYFSDSAMAALEPRCREIARKVVDDVLLRDAVDAVVDIAEPIALRTMCVFLGWPEHWWSCIRDWVYGNRAATFRRDRGAAHALAAEYEAIVTAALDDHRASGEQDDVTGLLMRTVIDGRHWTDQDIIATLRNWIAGHGTAAAMIGIVLSHLAEDNELQQRLRDNPGLIPAAVVEMSRVDGPLVANARTTTREVQIDDRTIASGERISLMWIAANRDPSAFEHADAVRLERDQGGNLLYGAGIHYCLGAPLARLEARVTIEALLSSTTNMSLATDATLERETYPGNGFISVPVDLR